MLNLERDRGKAKERGVQKGQGERFGGITRRHEWDPAVDGAVVNNVTVCRNDEVGCWFADLGEEAGARPGFAVGRVKSVKTEHGSTNADVLHTDGSMTKTTPLNQARAGPGRPGRAPGAVCF